MKRLMVVLVFTITWGCHGGGSNMQDGTEEVFEEDVEVDIHYVCTAATQAVDCDDGHVCTIDECDETLNLCTNTPLPAGTVCRPAIANCDAEETCDGISADCPPDLMASGSSLCREEAGICDVAEYCTGISADCPADAFAPDTVACRPAVGECDVAEFCPGDALDCPPDSWVPAGAPCDDDSYCTFPDVCDGSGTCGGPDSGVLEGVAEVSLGDDHACAVLETGTVMCWGGNRFGQLGDGTTDDSAAPVAVTGLPAAAASISAGYSYTCAVLSTGGAWCWGNGYDTSPVEIEGLSSGVAAISAMKPINCLGYAMGRHTCALMESGEVKCWGANFWGQLGDGTTNDSVTPVSVTLPSSAVSVSVGDSFTCAVLATGGVMCWGANNMGQLGNGDYDTDWGIPHPDPSGVLFLYSGAAEVACGCGHSCVLMTSSEVMCWGLNDQGQLGTGNPYAGVTYPESVENLPDEEVLEVRTGLAHTCAVLESGSVMCWGSDWYDGLGDGSVGWEDSDLPVMVAGLDTGVLTVDAGIDTNCVVLDTHSVECWGRIWEGFIPHQDPPPWTTAAKAGDLSNNATLVAPGGCFTCALETTGDVECWGCTESLGIARGTLHDCDLPIPVTGLSSEATAVAAGPSHACALISGGAACWGSNMWGELGGDTTDPASYEPLSVMGLSSTPISIAPGGSYTCALLATGEIMCWGRNNQGLGDGTTTWSRTPVTVTGLSGDAAELDSGNGHICAVVSDGSVMCWGDNTSGQLGDGTTTHSPVPVTATGLTEEAAALDLGYGHTCAVLSTGEVVCWGANDQGQLGDGTTTPSATPVAVEGLAAPATDVVAGEAHTCALLSTGSVMCWGDNTVGQLGNGTTAPSPTPVEVVGLPADVVSIGGGTSHTCALSSGGEVYCWGSDAEGRISGFNPGCPNPVCMGL